MDRFIPAMALLVLAWQWPAVMAAGEPRTLVAKGSGSVLALAYSKDGKTLAVGGSGGAILLDVATSKVQHYLLDGDRKNIVSVAFSPDDTKVAAGGGESQKLNCDIYVWKVALGGLWGTLREPNIANSSRNPTTSLAYAPDGKTLASAGGDDQRNQVKLWDMATLKKKPALTAHMEIALCVAYSWDGKTLASSGRSSGQINEGKPCVIDLWDAATGKERALLKGHTGAVYSVAFSKDGKTLASAGSDETIKLWDLTTQKERFTLKGNAGEVLAVAFSLDGKTLASANEDSTVKLWDVATGKELATLKGHKGKVTCLAFSPNATTLASGGVDTMIKLWRVSDGSKLLNPIEEKKYK